MKCYKTFIKGLKSQKIHITVVLFSIPSVLLQFGQKLKTESQKHNANISYWACLSLVKISQLQGLSCACMAWENPSGCVKRKVSFCNKLVFSICTPTSSSLFHLSLPQTRTVIQSSLIPLSSPSPLPFPHPLCLNFHQIFTVLLSPCNCQLLHMAHALCVTVGHFGFSVVKTTRELRKSVRGLGVVNTQERFYLLSDVVDPGRRAVAEIRSLGLPDPVWRKTPESCNTWKRKAAVFIVIGCILSPGPHVTGFISQWQIPHAKPGSLLVPRTLVGHFESSQCPRLPSS